MSASVAIWQRAGRAPLSDSEVEGRTHYSTPPLPVRRAAIGLEFEAGLLNHCYTASNCWPERSWPVLRPILRLEIDLYETLDLIPEPGAR